MAMNEIITTEDAVAIGVKILLIALSLVQIAPIKINPWDAILNWIGARLNRDLTNRVETVEKKLDEHIRKSDDERIRKMRADILDFSNSCMNGRRHTREEYDFCLSECDYYEQYCRDNGVLNGVISASIAEIRRLYSQRLRKNDFLKEGDGQ